MKRPDLELMRYHDLESDAEEHRRVEERLASDEVARDYLASLRTTSAAVQTWAEAARIDDIADEVMDRIERDVAERKGQVRRLRRLSWSLLGSGLAAAAALWLWVGSAAVDARQPSVDPLVRLPAVAPAAEPARSLAEIGAGVAIEKLDFGANNGSIFVIQGSTEATPVVWLSDPEGDRAKMEPL